MRCPRRSRLIGRFVVAAVLAVLAVPAQACVGEGCINIFAEGGALTTTWDFATSKMQTFKSFCAGGICLYSGIDPGFRHGVEPAPDGLEPVADGTRIRLEVVARDASVTFRLNGEALGAGESSVIGTTPDLHNHPSWQLSLPEGVEGDYALSFRLTTDSDAYADSQIFTAWLTNLPTPTPDQPSPSPTPTSTVAVELCPGDCNGDGAVTVDELVRGVGAALGGAEVCAALDLDGDGAVSVSELVAAVNSALAGCRAGPTPTATRPPTLALIQATVFSPRCSIPTCHDSRVRSGDLVLEDGRSHAQLVGVEPDIDTARAAGLLRVDPGVPANSFLLIKLAGPPPDQGSRMPLTGGLLDDAEVGLIRAWIAAGALDD